MMADAEAVGGRKNFIIIVLKDKLKMDELTPELRTYMRTYTYLKATKNTDKMVKRLRYLSQAFIKPFSKLPKIQVK